MVKNNYSKSYRLRSKIDFQNLRIGSSSISRKYFRVYFKSNCTDYSRLGISASKKSGNAIFRNKIKRQTREIFRISRNKKTGFDILIVYHNKLKIRNLIEEKTKIINDLYKVLNGELNERRTK